MLRFCSYIRRFFTCTNSQFMLHIDLTPYNTHGRYNSTRHTYSQTSKQTVSHTHSTYACTHIKHLLSYTLVQTLKNNKTYKQTNKQIIIFVLFYFCNICTCLASCRYEKSQWTECNAETNVRTRTLSLKKGDEGCIPTRTIQKKCKKGKCVTHIICVRSFFILYPIHFPI